MIRDLHDATLHCPLCKAMVVCGPPNIPILTEIVEERTRQDEKYGGPEHDDAHHPCDWVFFIDRFRANAQRSADLGQMDAYRKSLVRVAALAVAALESFDRKVHHQKQIDLLHHQV